MPVWQQEDIQQAASDVETLTQKLREYSAANETEKPALLEDLKAISAAMDEGALTEYVSLLTQIQSLMDSGMSESEIQAMFPEIDFTTALEQIASIQAFLNNRELELPGLPPKNITAMASAYKELDAGTDMSQLKPDEITAYISQYMEMAGVDTSGLSPDGIMAFVLAYGEVTGITNAESSITQNANNIGLKVSTATYHC